MSGQWEVEYTDELGVWWNGLTEAEQESVDASVRLLEERGPNLGYPHSSGIAGSRHSHMRELRVQHAGRPFEFSMLSIRSDMQSFYWAAIRQGTIVGTRFMCRWQTGSMTPT